jgi:hypothetical protein
MQLDGLHDESTTIGAHIKQHTNMQELQDNRTLFLFCFVASCCVCFNLLTSFVRQRDDINTCFIITLHISTHLGHQMLPLKLLVLLYCNVTFKLALSLIQLIRSSLLNQLKCS